MYTYAFVLQSAASTALPAGISGELVLLYEQDVGAVVEPGLDLAALEQSDERLMRAVLHHDQVIREIFEQVSVLPLRFGTQFVSPEKLLEHLRLNANVYQATLTRLAGHAEYTLKLSPRSPASADSDPAPVPSKGRDYFLAKKQQFQQQLDRQQQQQLELQALKEAIAQDYPALKFDEPRDGVERLHLLVKRQAEAALHEALADWRSRCPGWHLALSEALPPYHFV